MIRSMMKRYALGNNSPDFAEIMGGIMLAQRIADYMIPERKREDARDMAHFHALVRDGLYNEAAWIAWESLDYEIGEASVRLVSIAAEIIENISERNDIYLEVG